MNYFTQTAWWSRLFTALAVTVVLAGCDDGVNSNAANTPTGIQTSEQLSLVGAPDTEVTANTNYFFQPYADASTGAVTYSIEGKPEWLSFNATSGTLSGTPTEAQVGTSADITINANTTTASGSVGPFKIKVNGKSATPSVANYPPSISGTPATVVAANQSYNFAPTATDPEGAALTFSIVNRPTWATFDTSTGKLSGTPSTANLGKYTDILIRVSDGVTSAALPAFSIQVNAPLLVEANAAPTIGGSPTITVLAGSAYSFTPSAADANGDALTFLVQNKPAWATFSTATGQLYGTPGSANVGVASNIVISVSDGKLSTSLSAFTVSVSGSATVTGSAWLSWTAPTQNSDGSPLTDLTGYHVIYGKDPNNLLNTVDLPWNGVLSYQATNLDAGTWYFTIRAYNSAGVEGAQPTVVSKTIS